LQFAAMSFSLMLFSKQFQNKCI